MRRDEYWLHESDPPLLVGRGPGVQLEPPIRLGEIYLQLLRLDLDDPAAIKQFAQTHGTVSGAIAHQAVSQHSWFSSLFAPEVDDAARDTVIASDHNLNRLMNPKRRDWQLTEISTLDSFRFAARLLRDLTNAWQVVQAGTTINPVADRWELPYPAPRDDTAPECFALHLLEAALPRLLARFSPRIGSARDTWDGETPPPEELATEDRRWVVGRTGRSAEAQIQVHNAPVMGADLVELCALELHNHIVGGAVYRICSNVNCGAPFVRQYGREQHGMSKREGVLYCSANCARATASRAYRQRRTIEKSKQARQHAVGRSARANQT